MSKTPYIYRNDDYTGIDAGKYSFYFGYEQTYCTKCKSSECKFAEYDYHYDNTHWCFVVTKGKEEIFRLPIKEFEDITHGFYLGMAQFLKKNLK